MFGIKASIGRHPNGYSLVELLVSLTIAAAIGGVIAVGISQTQSVSTRSNNHNIVSTQLQDAGLWIQADTMRAQAIDVGQTGSGLPLTLSWVEWDNTAHSAVYSLSGTSSSHATLKRTHIQNGTTESAKVLIDCVIPADIYCSYTPTEMLRFHLTASRGAGSTGSTQSRTFEYKPRPNS